ncbi:MAG: nucleoside triphosphate pyrophosphatase [Lysobacterales bacterium]
MNSTAPHIYLASQSPRRRELLTQIGVEHEVLALDVPEHAAPGEAPLAYVARVARDKALAGWQQVADRAGARVLAADTEVVLDERIFGKPADAGEAAEMLRSLSGREHLVPSAVVLIGHGFEETRMSLTRVRFRALSANDIDAYLASGEWRGKAGAYAIQGRAGAFIERIDGSYTGVMGLPLFETSALLSAAR